MNELLSKVNRLIRRTAQSLAACEASLQKLNVEKEKLVEKERLYDMQLKKPTVTVRYEGVTRRSSISPGYILLVT